MNDEIYSDLIFDNDKVELKLCKFESFEKLIQRVSLFFVDLMGMKKTIADNKNEINFICEEIKETLNEDLLTFIEILSFIETGNRFISHSLKTTIFAYFIAISLDFSDQKLDALITASLLHDIGKLKLPDKFSYILGSDKNTSDKEKLFKHPQAGYRVLREDFRYPDNIAKLVLNHHEQLDGMGYPNKLKEQDLTKGDRILFTANFIENLLHATQYNGIKAMVDSLENAFNKYPQKFDGEIVVKLFSMLKKSSRFDRKEERFTLASEAIFKIKNQDDNIEQKGRIIDISIGGARMLTAEKLNIGDKLDISFNLGVNKHISDLLCLVMRIDMINRDTYSLGLKYIEVNENNKSIINSFINSLKK